MERKGRGDKGERSICEIERETGSVLSHRSDCADSVGGGHCWALLRSEWTVQRSEWTDHQKELSREKFSLLSPLGSHWQPLRQPFQWTGSNFLLGNTRLVKEWVEICLFDCARS